MSEDSQLIRFFTSRQGGDIYVFMASLCFECDEAEVTKEQRTCAKQLSLAIQYGMGRDNMAKKLTRFTGRTYTESEAARLIQKWYDLRTSAASSSTVQQAVSCPSSWQDADVCVMRMLCRKEKVRLEANQAASSRQAPFPGPPAYCVWSCSVCGAVLWRHPLHGQSKTASIDQRQNRGRITHGVTCCLLSSPAITHHSRSMRLCRRCFSMELGRCGAASGLCLVSGAQKRTPTLILSPTDAHRDHCCSHWRCAADIQHGNSWKRSQAERQAVNSVIQGTAADMAKRAMIAIHEYVQRLHEQSQRPFPSLARLTLQLHDEIILEVRSGLEVQVAAEVRHCMESVFVPPKGEAEARVPFPVSLKVGRTLGSLQPFELPSEQPRQEQQQQQQQQREDEVVAGNGVVDDEVRALMELASVDEEEWNDYSGFTAASRQLRSSLASAVTAHCTPSTPRTAILSSIHHQPPCSASPSLQLQARAFGY